MKWWAIFVVFLTIPLLSANKHPIYISKTEVHFRPNSERLEFSMQLFIDDLEDALEEEYDKSIEIGTNREEETTEALVWDYVQDHFEMTINGKEQALTYYGREITNDEIFSMYLYFTIEGVATIDELEVKNTLLHEVIDDQRNFVLINAYDDIKRLVFIKNDNLQQCTF